jgi:hypothetical protein
MADILSRIPETLILGVLIVVAVFFLLAPLTLRLAGLSGQQIIDVFTMTTKFVVELISEFRSENKSAK